MANSIVKQEIWVPAFIENLRNNVVALSFADDTAIVSGGSAKILSVGDVTTGTYTPNTDFTVGDATIAGNTITLNQAPYWAISVDDLEVAQSSPGIVQKITLEGAYAISAAVDKYILGLHGSAATANKLTGSAGAALNFGSVDVYETLVDAGTALTLQGVPLNGRWLVLTPEVYARVLKDKDHFIRASALGDMVVSTARFPGSTPNSTPGFVGQIAGFDTYVSNNVAKASSNAYLVYGQGKPFHFASQLGQVEAARPAKQFSTILKQLLAFGAAVLGPNTKRIGSIYVVNS